MYAVESNKKNNVHIYPGTILFEARTFKITRTISKLNIYDNIYILGINNGDLPESEVLEDNIIIKRLKIKEKNWAKKGFFYRIYNVITISIATFKFLVKTRPKVVHAHSLSVLPISAIYKIFYRNKLVYDTHELETERHGWKMAEKLLAKIIEFIFIYFTDKLVVVNEAIGDFYEKKYSIKPVIINNAPKIFKTENSNYLKEKYRLPNDQKVFIYIGALSRKRGIEEYIKYFQKTDLNISIIFLGDGPLKEFVKNSQKTSKNIFLHPLVSFDEVVKITSSADYSISILRLNNPALSYDYMMPNKLFESMMAGIPILSGGMKHEADFIKRNGMGEVLNFKNSIPQIEESINKILSKDYNKMSENCLKLSKKYNWENQELKIDKYVLELFKL
tara:strand:- start:3314 stop:4483 length:1170 start_codon:yes stop_codon:yes gene_type:complete